MPYSRFAGLIAAVLTPLDVNTKQVVTSVIPATADHLLDSGASGFYCCGSTGLERLESDLAVAGFVI